jgi:glucokinase
LRSRLGVPIVLENDANAAAFGEHWVGAGRGGGDLVMLTLGTGVGAGVILNGRLLHGHFENAAELGHMIVVPNGLPCPCGQRGCLEAYASAASVARRAVSAVAGGEPSALRGLADGGYPIDAEQVARLAQEGDKVCHRIWEEACIYLALACVNVEHAFNPAMIVLGGGLAAAGSFLLDGVHDHFLRQRWSFGDDAPTIALAALGDDAGVSGAAGLAWAGYEEPCGTGLKAGPLPPEPSERPTGQSVPQ